MRCEFNSGFLIMKFICKNCDDKSVLYEIRDYLKRRCPKYIEYMKV